MDRMASRSKLDIYENLEFQQQVAAAYRRAIGDFEGLGMRIVRIDASLHPDAVEQAVWQAVQPLVKPSIPD
jgi:thymidylate kinase